jgi:mRNA-degrading endonuclease RelE of RelBE toxin-antitoxin system
VAVAIFSRQARWKLHEHLPPEVAVAVMATIDGPIAINPHRVGKPLDDPFDGYRSARRGTYRIVTALGRCWLPAPASAARSVDEGTLTGQGKEVRGSTASPDRVDHIPKSIGEIPS